MDLRRLTIGGLAHYLNISMNYIQMGAGATLPTTAMNHFPPETQVTQNRSSS